MSCTSDSIYRMQREHLERAIALIPTTVVLESGGTVKGVMRMLTDNPDQLQGQGAVNVSDIHRYAFRSLTPLPETEAVTVNGFRYEVLDCGPMHAGGGVIGYRSVLLERLADQV